MSDKLNLFPDRKEANGDNEDYARHHLEAAGPRPEVSAEALDRVSKAARAEWQKRWERRPERESPLEERFSGERQIRASRPHAGSAISHRLRNREKKSRRQSLALAAVVLALLGAGTWWWLRSMPAAAIAIVDQSLGISVQEAGPGERGVPMVVGSDVPAGAWITTQAGARIAFRFSDGLSLRVDSDSRVRLESNQRIELERGALYVDTRSAATGRTPRSATQDESMPEESGHRLTIETPVGVAWDLGTQFELRLTDGGTMRIRVREGSVAVENRSREHVARQGEQLLVKNDGSATTTPIDRFGQDWAWILDLAPRLEGDRLTVGELLDWVTRENGWQCQWDDAALESAARRRPVSGDIGRLDPERAAIVALPAAGLEATVQDGVLLIRQAD